MTKINFCHLLNGIIKEAITLLNFSTMFWTLYKF